MPVLILVILIVVIGLWKTGGNQKKRMREEVEPEPTGSTFPNLHYRGDKIRISPKEGTDE